MLRRSFYGSHQIYQRKPLSIEMPGGGTQVFSLGHASCSQWAFRPLAAGPLYACALKELSEAELNAMVEEAAVAADGEDEQLSGFYNMIEDNLAVPFGKSPPDAAADDFVDGQVPEIFGGRRDCRRVGRNLT